MKKSNFYRAFEFVDPNIVPSHAKQQCIDFWEKKLFATKHDRATKRPVYPDDRNEVWAYYCNLFNVEDTIWHFDVDFLRNQKMSCEKKIMQVIANSLFIDGKECSYNPEDDKFKAPHCTEEIPIVSHLPLSTSAPFTLIDGNHRVTANIKQSRGSFPCLYVPETVLIQSLLFLSESMEVAFLFDLEKLVNASSEVREENLYSFGKAGFLNNL